MSDTVVNGSDYIKSIEKATLIEEIKLPEISTGNINLHFFESGKTLKLAQNVYKDTPGKFYINILSPLIDRNDALDSSYKMPKLLGHKGQKLNINKYSSSNYITLIIPKYILMDFTNVIPKGTEFLVGFVGKSTSIDNIQVIGVLKDNK